MRKEFDKNKLLLKKKANVMLFIKLKLSEVK